MTDPDETIDSGDALDAALREAFGGSGPPGGNSILAVLETTIGSCSRVLLRDTAEEPVVVPLSRELVSSARDGSRYQIAGELAQGGVGIILKSRDVDLGRDVAMKTLRPEHVNNLTMIHRFVEEAQIAGQLQHPGIIPVYELGVLDERTPYFTMKLVRGQTLAALFEEGPGTDRARRVKIFEQICQTLAYAHDRGVIHRDLKPSNVLVGTFGEVQVVDWGLAKVLARGGVADEARRTEEGLPVETVRSTDGRAESMTGSVMGTPAYMAPEQARGEVERLDERCDVFALGAILCEILTGAPPFQGTRAEVLEQARAGDLEETFRSLEACDADADLKSLARRCLAPLPSDRPRHAGGVREAITEYLASVEERMRSAELQAAQAETRVVEERRARKWIGAAGILGILIVVIVATGIFWVQQESRQRIGAQSKQVHTLVDRASDRLARATVATVGDAAPWFEARTAAELVRDAVENQPGIDDVSRGRAREFLDRFERADADRAISESIENAVIIGATHLDPVSWTQMEKDLREAFLSYGVDVTAEDHRAIVAGLKRSELHAQLADGYELWIATAMHLHSMGVHLYPVEDLVARVEILYEVDPDPFARDVRQILYSPKPIRDGIDEILKRYPDFSEHRPRTLSWLAGVCFRVQDLEGMHSIYRRALVIYPDDFMLNFDYAYHLRMADQREKANRYAMRCLALRPRNANVWRTIGELLHEGGELVDAADALERAASLEPDNAGTLVQLAQVLTELERADEAASVLESALEIDPDLTPAREALQQLREKP